MQITIQTRTPQDIPDSQQQLLNVLIECAENDQEPTEALLMERLNLKVVDALRSRFRRLQESEIISGYIEPNRNIIAA